MSRLADGRYRCPSCEGAFDVEAMTTNQSYCRPCSRSKAAATYAERRALERERVQRRGWRMAIPDEFATVAPGMRYQELVVRYGVSRATISRWRQRLALPPTRMTLPADFASTSCGMSAMQVAERWGVHADTARRWLRSVAPRPKRGRPGLPVPADWASVCARMHVLAVAKHYGVTRNVVYRWVRVSGVSPIRVRRGGALVNGARRVNPATPPPRPELPSGLSVQCAPVLHISGCRDCSATRLCRACEAARLQADIEAWLAAGNRPAEVPVGVSGQPRIAGAAR